MTDTSILNEVVDTIFDSPHLEISNEELDTAIKEQLMKVMNFIVNPDPILIMSITIMYILIMVKYKSTDVEKHFPYIAISSDHNRIIYEKTKKEAYALAINVFKKDIEIKL